MSQGKLFDVQALQQPPAANKFAGGKHWLFVSLLNGCYIKERGGKSSFFTHCLFEPGTHPVKKVSKYQWKHIMVYTRKKKTKYGDLYFINLQEVRALSGRYTYKKLYKKFRKELKLKQQSSLLIA